MASTSRREFVAQTGALFGAIAVGGLGAAAGAPAAPRVALEAQRLETFAGLADAVLTQEPYRLAPAAAVRAADDFAAVYATWDAPRRARADAVLDALERADSAGFRQPERGKRVRVLRDYSTPTSAWPGPAERRRLDLAENALVLLGSVVGADDAVANSTTTD